MELSDHDLLQLTQEELPLLKVSPQNHNLSRVDPLKMEVPCLLSWFLLPNKLVPLSSTEPNSGHSGSSGLKIR